MNNTSIYDSKIRGLYQSKNFGGRLSAVDWPIIVSCYPLLPSYTGLLPKRVKAETARAQG